MGCPQICHHAKFQIFLYSLGCFAGLVAFVYFGFQARFFCAATFGIACTFYTGLLLFDILKLHKIQDGCRILPREDIQTWLTIEYWVTIGALFIGFAGMCTLIIYGVLEEERLAGPSFMGAVQSWMLFKWSLACVFHLYRYHTVVEDAILTKTLLEPKSH